MIPQTLANLPASKTIALVAHDNKKSEMLEWCQQHETLLAQHQLIGTGTTGLLIEKNTDLKINPLVSGPLGGDQQIGGMIAEHKVHMLVFFWDPFEPLPHDPDVKALLRIAAVWNIPVACNQCSANLIIESPAFSEEISRPIPDYQAYLKQRV